MPIPESCVQCIYEKQKKVSTDPEFLRQIRQILASPQEDDTAPSVLYRCDQLCRERFGESGDFREEKKRYNDLALSIEQELMARLEKAEDPVRLALLFSRVGNYIDFGALPQVDPEKFMALLPKAAMNATEEETYQSFLSSCEKARSFLLIADNCGEIVLDKLLILQLKKRFPRLRAAVMVRGGNVLNDASEADAVYAGVPDAAEVISSGAPVAGTVYSLLSDAARAALDGADVILAKGQGNFESLANQGRHVFFMFLCKCDHFMRLFGVPQYTGMFLEEKEEA